MSDIVQSTIDSQACLDIQKQLFLFLISKYVNSKKLSRFNYEHCIDPSLPPIDMYFVIKQDTNTGVKKYYQFIEVKAGKNINSFEEFCGAIYNFYKILNFLDFNKTDLDNPVFYLYHSQTSNFIHQLKFVKSKHTSLKSASDYRPSVKKSFLLEIKTQIERKTKIKIKNQLLEKTIKTVIPIQIEEEMIIDDFKYLYWNPIFPREIESKYSYILESIMEFNKHRRKNKHYEIFFDEYLFTKEDNKRFLGEVKPDEFISEYGLSADIVIPQPSTSTITQEGGTWN